MTDEYIMPNPKARDIHNQLIALGMKVEQISADKIPSEVDEKLFQLLWNAYGKNYADPAVIALRDYLGVASVQWLAYKAYRLDYLDDKRVNKLPLKQLFRFLRIWAEAPVTETPAGSGYYVVRPKMADWNKFRLAMQDIITALPDEE